MKTANALLVVVNAALFGWCSLWLVAVAADQPFSKAVQILGATLGGSVGLALAWRYSDVR